MRYNETVAQIDRALMTKRDSKTGNRATLAKNYYKRIDIQQQRCREMLVTAQGRYKHKILIELNKVTYQQDSLHSKMNRPAYSQLLQLYKHTKKRIIVILLITIMMFFIKVILSFNFCKRQQSETLNDCEFDSFSCSLVNQSILLRLLPLVHRMRNNDNAADDDCNSAVAGDEDDTWKL
uniref:Uncharacterized protein n=1 Tax=Glossina brevipalpis TaxID=37001 RepID=A0A1A9WVK0_9MUSC